MNSSASLQTLINWGLMETGEERQRPNAHEIDICIYIIAFTCQHNLTKATTNSHKMCMRAGLTRRAYEAKRCIYRMKGARGDLHQPRRKKREETSAHPIHRRPASSASSVQSTSFSAMGEQQPLASRTYLPSSVLL
jgi:hypothetical protein